MTNSATDDAVYFARVVEEIEAEAQRRVESGEYPRALLRSLDEEFRRWIPDTGRAGGVEDAIRAIEAAAYVDAGVPVESNKRVGVYVKTAVRKATYFYHRHMAQQIAALGIQITRPMRLLDATTKQLDARVAALEDLADVHAGLRDELVAGLDIPGLRADDLDAIARHLDVQGRVMIGEIDEPGLVDHLHQAEIDCYGVGSGLAGRPALELRDEPLADHIEKLEQSTLAGALLTGVTHRAALNEQLRTLSMLLGRLDDNGRLVVVSPDPERWADALGPVGADLVRGRPLHHETWTHLLRREGATVDEVLVPSADRAAAVVMATVHR